VEPTEEELALEAAEAEAEGEEVPLFVPHRLYADVSASMLYRFTNTEFGWFVLDGTLYPTARTNIRANLGYDLEETQIAEGFLRFAWTTETGHDLYAGYRYLRTIPAFFEDFQTDSERFDEFEEDFNSINQIDLGFRWAVTRSWAVSWDFRYAIEDSLLLTNRAAIEYISKCLCWAARVRVEDDRSSGIEWGVDYVLIGLGNDTVRPFRGGIGVRLDGNRGL
jgi:lipopolysaccharide assembly outer membrane protein LptD (OstA)